jgi:hypothetical protein
MYGPFFTPADDAAFLREMSRLPRALQLVRLEARFTLGSEVQAASIIQRQNLVEIAWLPCLNLVIPEGLK